MTGAGRPSTAMLAAMLAATLLAGCATNGRAVRLGDRAAPRDAVARAEGVTAASPRDPAARLALARSYMAAGRFVSAGKTYQDVLALAPEDKAAAIGLALMETAVGRPAVARTRLAALAEAPPADAGLARALAGDVAGAIELLGDAARGPAADSRVRQNLALALALAGRWQEARAVAAQDLPPDLVDQRLGEWAQIGGTPDPAVRVALVLGTRAAADSGQPQALALTDPPAAAVALATVAPVVEPVHAALPPAVPLRLAAGPVAVPTMVVPQVRRFVFLPARSDPAPMPKSGRYVVQLGAYSTEERAERAWRLFATRLGRRMPLVARRGPRALVRLSVGGFASRGEARETCRATGADCFVRPVLGDRLASWWPANARQQLAAR